MRVVVNTVVLCSIVVTAIPVFAGELASPVVELARQGRTSWQVFVPPRAGVVERFARDELKEYVEQMSGAKLGDAERPDQPHTICLGLRPDLGLIKDRVKDWIDQEAKAIAGGTHPGP